jgi:hypothetical protein
VHTHAILGNILDPAQSGAYFGPMVFVAGGAFCIGVVFAALTNSPYRKYWRAYNERYPDSWKRLGGRPQYGKIFQKVPDADRDLERLRSRVRWYVIGSHTCFLVFAVAIVLSFSAK